MGQKLTTSINTLVEPSVKAMLHDISGKSISDAVRMAMKIYIFLKRSGRINDVSKWLLQHDMSMSVADQDDKEMAALVYSYLKRTQQLDDVIQMAADDAIGIAA